MVNNNKVHTLSAQIVNFGCKLNQFEGESLKEALIEKGIEARMVHPSELNHRKNEKIVYIINTCTVTSKSDRKARNAIYKAASLKRNGDLLIVTGCYAHTDANELRKIEGVDFVVGNFEKPLIPEMINIGNVLKIDDIGERDRLIFSYRDSLSPDRSRVYVKVQDGCSMRCSYCKIPLARGKSVSRPVNEIIDYLKRLEGAGYHEAVLTGINLGSYKYNHVGLSELLEKIIVNTRSIGIRLSSIEPMYFKDGLFDVLENDRIMPHFHVPLQSGSDRILKLMKRPYSIEDFIEIIEGLRRIKRLPHLATDIIVGFPTEKIKDFENSYEIIKSLKFSSIHVFTYSPRKGTEAAEMEDDVPTQEKSKRSHMLIDLGKYLNFIYRSTFLDSLRIAIFERHNKSWIGVTDNYIKVTLQNNTNLDLRKKRSTIKIVKVTPQKTFAILASKLE